jgi:abortive infection bacteriophage resistance protein
MSSVKILKKNIIDSTEVFINHHKQKYSGALPIWVAIELLSFGTLSKMFKNLKKVDSDFICKEIYKVKSFYVQNWLHALAVMRNICAHYGRIYNRLLPVDINLFKKEMGIRKNSFFALNLVLKRLITDRSQWKTYVTSLEALIEQYNCVDIKRLGFPEDWQKLLR